jgi:hypothetical protein
MRSKTQALRFDNSEILLNKANKNMFCCWCGQLLTIMSRSIAYLTSHVNFSQVSQEIPITKQRNPDKVDPPDVFEGTTVFSLSAFRFFPLCSCYDILTYTRSKPVLISEQEGTRRRPHGESKTDRISYPVAPNTGTGRHPGTRSPTLPGPLGIVGY